MTPFEILYACSTTIAVLASFPQIRQLLIAKRSDELSVATWALWLGTQFVSLAYAASIANHLLIGVNCVWITFYAVMLCLILYYRRSKPQSLATLALESIKIDDEPAA